MSHTQREINRLAKFIMEEFPSEFSGIDKTDSYSSEGTVSCAIRLLKKYYDLYLIKSEYAIESDFNVICDGCGSTLDPVKIDAGFDKEKNRNFINITIKFCKHCIGRG